MTSEQSSKLQSILKRYNITPRNDPDTINYILIMFGIGFGMSVEDIERYVFTSNREKVIDKDLCRIAMLLELPEPKPEVQPEEFIQEVVKKRKEQENLCLRYEALMEQSGLTLEEAEQRGEICLADDKTRQDPYQEIRERILTESGFSASQLDQVQRAVELQMPEDMILHFATLDRTPLQMARYIDFYQIQGKDQKTGSRQNLFSKIKKYLRRKDEQNE